MNPTLWILSGPSGAGKATALAALADAGVEYVDNLPVDLLEGFVLLPRTRSAVTVLDARQGDALHRFEPGSGARVLFLDARDDVLLRRLNNRVRPHLATLGRGRGGLESERALLTSLRAAADTVIDTSDLQDAELQERVRTLVVSAGEVRRLTCTISSFGYKFGPQLEADWVVDSRLMPNPFWEPALRPLTGLDGPVREFVLDLPEAKHLLHELTSLVSWAAERCRNHNRFYLQVAIGCTGGRHRSVVLAEELATRLRRDEFDIEVRHRDVQRPDPR